MSEPPPALDPLPYHRDIVAYLQREQRELWDWYSSNRVQEEHAESMRLELLKSAYRIDRETAPLLHQSAHEASRQLGLDAPIALYQSQRAGDGRNASLAFLPNQIHVVLHGSLTDVLGEPELQALFGHELSHYALWTGWEGEYLIADQILAAMTNDAAADTTQCESCRLYRLYTEIFCDRGARIACGELLPVVSTLVKIETGVRDVSAESYLRQSAEIFSHEQSTTSGFSHPECYIRARALQLWDGQDADADVEIRRMIEGPLALDQLDLLGQRRVNESTRRLVDAFLAPGWMQTEINLGHARLFFEGYARPSAAPDINELAAELQTDDVQLQNYYCYVMLDFVTMDPDLEEAPLAAACRLTEEIGLAGRFEEIVRKELGLRKKQWERICKDAGRIMAAAEQEAQRP